MKVNFSSILNSLTERNTWKNSLRKILNLTVTDTDISGIETNVSDLGTDLTDLGTKFQKSYQTLTSAISVTMDSSISKNAEITLGHDVSLTISNLENGDEGNIILIQGASDYTFTITSPSPFVINDGGGLITVTSGSGAVTIVSYTYNGTRLYVTYGSNYTPAT